MMPWKIVNVIQHQVHNISCVMSDICIVLLINF